MDSAAYKKLLEKNNVKLVSVAEPISDGPEGILIETQFKQEKQAIEETYEKESVKNPTYTVEQYKMALANYRKVNINTLDGKRKILNTLYPKIYRDGKMHLLF